MSSKNENLTFEFKKAQLHYHKTGKGPNILLTFHGFGQSKHHFQHFEKVLKNTHTIYSFDLFYHGMSFWHEREKPISKKFWKELIDAFFKSEGIENLSLAGYSLGGKFVLATLEAFPDKIKKIILIAPDGININFWYYLATYTSFTRRFFRSLVINPKPFYKLVKIISKLNIMNKSIIKFTENQMNTRQKRRRVYYSWVIFRKLQFEMNKIASLINFYNIEVDIILGKYDMMITHKKMDGLLKRLNKFNLQILESGHSSLIDEVAKYYAQDGLKMGED